MKQIYHGEFCPLRGYEMAEKGNISYKYNKKGFGERKMKRKLVIDGNAVYEIDEDCMLGRRLDVEEKKEVQEQSEKEGSKEE